MKMQKPSAITPKLRRESSTLSDASMTSQSAWAKSTPRKLSANAEPKEPRSPGGAGLVTPATVKSTSMALKDQLRDKDQHIEQLLKERDMERAEVAKAANQTDEVETKLLLLRQEFDAYKKQGPEVELRDQLEEERKKVEDLQFRLEEAEILKTEGNKGSEEVEEDMKRLRAKIIEVEENNLKLKSDHGELENKLSDEQTKNVALEEKVATVAAVEKEKALVMDKVTMLFFIVTKALLLSTQGTEGLMVRFLRSGSWKARIVFTVEEDHC